MKEKEIIPGTPVRYYGVIMADGTKLDPIDTTVVSTPYVIGSKGHIVCKVADVEGGVSIHDLEKL